MSDERIRGAAGVMNFKSILFVGLVVGLWVANPNAIAGLILQPAGVVAQLPMGEQVQFEAVHLMSKSGLNASYTSGVTDFDAYIASNPTHDSSPKATRWAATPGNPTGNLDFDLGGTFMIESLAFWNMGLNSGSSVRNITLFADDNAAFSSPTNLGSYTASLSPNMLADVEVFAFPATSADYVRLQITSNYGSSVTQAGEVAFEVVPEPGSLAVFTLGGVMLARRRGRVA